MSHYATEWLARAAQAALDAMENEPRYDVREEHSAWVEELQNAIFYFDAHGRKEDAR